MFKHSMFRWLHHSHGEPDVPPSGPLLPSYSPPEWTAAEETSHDWGLNNEATREDYEAAERFCEQNPPNPPRFLASCIVDQIQQEGVGAWQIQHPSSPRFDGSIRSINDTIYILTHKKCQDVCLMSNLPILAGYYSRQGQHGVYYEIVVDCMAPDAAIALGSACLPYPEWRLPGWNRLSAGLHLDDMRKFFEDSNGGRDYGSSQRHLRRGDTFGYGYEFATGNIFFTRNGERLPNAFSGTYLPSRHDQPGPDVYAAVGVSGRTGLKVNFGREPFKWTEANTSGWRVERHVGTWSSVDEPPAYTRR